MEKVCFYLKKVNPVTIILFGIVTMWLFALMSDRTIVKFFGAFWGTIFTVMFAHIFCSKLPRQGKGSL